MFHIFPQFPSYITRAYLTHSRIWEQESEMNPFPSQFQVSILLLLALLLAGSAIEHLDPTLPPALPTKPPDCSLLVLHHHAGSPKSADFSPPDACPAPWTRVVLELSAAIGGGARGNHVAGVWIGGAEVLRTAAPISSDGADAFWRVRKDVTRYSVIFSRGHGESGGVVSVMVEGPGSDSDSGGGFGANVSLHFYRGWISEEAGGGLTATATAHPTVKGFYRERADLIIPVSEANGSNGSGFWFRANNRSHVPTAPVAIPRNSYRAVLEIFASYHAADEFWYANPLRNSYDPRLLDDAKANGGLRQVYATIDGKFIGGHIPLPTIYPGSINPYFWSPVSAIGAFDLPSYDLDVTPFLSLLLDGQAHEVGLGVKESQPYWLLTGNLHLWVDEWSNEVLAGLIEYKAPEMAMNRHAEWSSQDGSSEVDADGLVRFKGWVSSSKGNLTTDVRQKVTFKSQVAVQNRGAARTVEMVNKERTTVDVHRGNEVVSRVRIFVETPLQVQTWMVRAAGGAVFEKTKLSHQLTETVIVTENRAVRTIELTDRQDADGGAMMRDGVSIWGSGSTKSSYKYTDGSTCYIRAVNTDEGVVESDFTSPSCMSIADT